jgi:sortase A
MSGTKGLSSWFIAVAFVAGAGAIAWYGTARDSGSVAAGQPAQAVTIPAPVEDAVSTTEEPNEPAVVTQRRLVGSLPTQLNVPSAGITMKIDEVTVIKDDADEYVWETSWTGVGHHLNSARPGQPGNMVLTGHVSVARPEAVAAFENLNGVSVGDYVEVFSGANKFTYEVIEIRTVSPDDVSVLDGDHRARLTMITCTPNLEGRLVVVASLVT